MRLKKERIRDLIYFHEHPEQHPDSNFCCDDGEESALTLDYAALAASHEKLMQAHETLRDAVLNQRGALAENGMNSDQINDVLGEIDDAFSAALTEAEKLTK